AADHSVSQTGFGTKTLVFSAETFELASVFDADHRETGDGCKEMKIVLGEGSVGIGGFEIDEPERFFWGGESFLRGGGNHRHAKKTGLEFFFYCAWGCSR